MFNSVRRLVTALTQKIKRFLLHRKVVKVLHALDDNSNQWLSLEDICELSDVGLEAVLVTLTGLIKEGPEMIRYRATEELFDLDEENVKTRITKPTDYYHLPFFEYYFVPPNYHTGDSADTEVEVGAFAPA